MTSDARQSPRLRSRLKKLALHQADRIARRAGTMELPIEDLRQHLRERPGLTETTPAFSATGRVKHSGPIFLTGRFRSGTTLLWNIFRHCSGVTAYYEPFNERRWFDPATRGTSTDPTHRGVPEYWNEYDGLVELAALFRRRWHERNLYMAADARDPAMERYVQTLIERSPGRPVLQFNRIDFRLPWFRERFPEATIVQIVRNPRDQWCSTLIEPKDFASDGTSDHFSPHDHFYLRLWIEQLQEAFPFLPESYAAHPYRAFYLLWRLSRAFGVSFGDATVPFEALAADPRFTVGALLTATGVDSAGLNAAVALVDPPVVGRWPDYAKADWFALHEDAAEDALAGRFA